VKILNTSISILGIMMLALSAPALAGSKGSDAYFVKVDRDTTTQNSAQNNAANKPVSPQDSSSGMASGKRQHKPFVLTKPVDKASTDQANKAKKLSGMHKSGDITLKRGVVE